MPASAAQQAIAEKIKELLSDLELEEDVGAMMFGNSQILVHRHPRNKDDPRNFAAPLYGGNICFSIYILETHAMVGGDKFWFSDPDFFDKMVKGARDAKEQVEENGRVTRKAIDDVKQIVKEKWPPPIKK